MRAHYVAAIALLSFAIGFLLCALLAAHDDRDDDEMMALANRPWRDATEFREKRGRG
jgi:hypothetical protein